MVCGFVGVISPFLSLMCLAIVGATLVPMALSVGRTFS